MMKNKFAWLVFCIFCLTNCKKKIETAAAAPPKNMPIGVDAVVLKPSALTNSAEVNGSVLANEFVELRPEISGRLTFLNIKEGSFIEKGTVVAKMYDDDLQAQLKKVQAQIQLAQLNESRLRKLLDINAVNQQDYDVAQTQINTLNADVELINANLRKTQVIAPFSGVVGLRTVSMGAYVTPQTVMATLQEVNKMKIDFNVPENLAEKVKRGARVRVLSETNQAQTATVTAIEPQVNATSRNLKVRATIDGKTAWQAGMFVRVLLDTGGGDALFLPSQAIIPDTRNKKIFVIRNGKAVSTIVETGLRQQDKVQILTGANAGDTVAVTGILFLRPDAPAMVKNIL